MKTVRSVRRLAAVSVIALIAATGCSATKTASPPPSQTASPTASSTPAVSQSIDLTGLDRSLDQLDTEMSGANAGLKSTSEGDVQTQ